MSCFLVTGGAGFIGSHLVRALLDEGDTVRVLDDLSSGHRKNVPHQVELIEADVTDPAAVESALSKGLAITLNTLGRNPKVDARIVA